MPALLYSFSSHRQRPLTTIYYVRRGTRYHPPKQKQVKQLPHHSVPPSKYQVPGTSSSLGQQAKLQASWAGLADDVTAVTRDTCVTAVGLASGGPGPGHICTIPYRVSIPYRTAYPPSRVSTDT